MPAPHEPHARLMAWVNGVANLLPKPAAVYSGPRGHELIVRHVEILLSRKLGNMDTLEVFEVPMKRVPLKSNGTPDTAAEPVQSGSDIALSKHAERYGDVTALHKRVLADAERTPEADALYLLSLATWIDYHGSAPGWMLDSAAFRRIAGRLHPSRLPAGAVPLQLCSVEGCDAVAWTPTRGVMNPDGAPPRCADHRSSTPKRDATATTEVVHGEVVCAPSSPTLCADRKRYVVTVMLSYGPIKRSSVTGDYALHIYERGSDADVVDRWEVLSDPSVPRPRVRVWLKIALQDVLMADYSYEPTGL